MDLLGSKKPDAKADPATAGRRSQVCEVLADTGISRRKKMAEAFASARMSEREISAAVCAAFTRSDFSLTPFDY